MIRFDELTKNNLIKEIRVGEFYLTILVCVNQYNPNKITLCILPSIVFRNQLPRTVTLKIFYGDGLTPKEIVVLSNGVHYEHSQSSSVDISVIMIFDNFKPSKTKLLLSQREKPPKSITLKEYKNDKLKVQIDYKKKGSQIFTFFSAFTIINSSTMPLNFFYRKSGLSEAVGGQSYIENIVPCSPTMKLAIGIGKEKSE